MKMTPAKPASVTFKSVLAAQSSALASLDRLDRRRGWWLQLLMHVLWRATLGSAARADEFDEFGVGFAGSLVLPNLLIRYTILGVAHLVLAIAVVVAISVAPGFRRHAVRDHAHNLATGSMEAFDGSHDRA